MGITVITDVHCDICKANWINGAVGDKAAVRQARQAAKRAGWIRRLDPLSGKMIDICPECIHWWSTPPAQQHRRLP